MRELVEPGEQDRAASLTPLLICFVASLVSHLAILAFSAGSKPERPSGSVFREPLSVTLGRESIPPAAEPAPPEATSAPRPIPLDEKSHPESRAATPAEAEPPGKSRAHTVIERDFDPRSLDIQEFLEGYGSSDTRTDVLPFHPDLGRHLLERRAAQKREASVQRNSVQRYGHDEDHVNSTGSMTKVGRKCYATSEPLITIQQGQRTTEVDCPGIPPWWARDQLEEVAEFRGIP